MNAVLLLRCVVFSLVLLGVGSVYADGAKPNVLFLICDDLNCDLGVYGHPQVQSPHIDRLAARGVKFDRAYCQYPLCGPSRASFMTGLYPDQTRIKANSIYLRTRLPNVQTMSQMFRQAGYMATRIGKIYHYNVPRNIGTSGHDDPYSWDFTINPRGRDTMDESSIFSLKPGHFGATLSWRADEGADDEQTDGIAATEATELLEQYANTSQPFFLAVGLYRPHTPFVAPKKYFEMYPLAEIVVPEVPTGYLDTIPRAAQKTVRFWKDQIDLEDSLARRAIQAYHASISFADAQVGRILDALESTGLAENTIVVFTSDHGYHMGEHGHWQKRTLYDNGSRVPLIVAGPGVEATGASTLAPAEMIDFYPTLAELCGLKPPKYLSGVSLVPVLRDPDARPRSEALTQLQSGYSIRTERFRYTEWGPEGHKGRELYDSQSDPAEMVNLAEDEDYSDLIEELAERLHRRIEAAQQAPLGVQQLKK